MSESLEREPLNRIAPIIFVLLLGVAGWQVWSSLGEGTGIRAEIGEVSEADLVEETTTTLSQRTFVTLAPLEERDPAAPVTRRATPTTASETTDSQASSTNDRPGTTGDDGSTTAPPTTRPTDTSATVGSSTPSSDTTRPTDTSATIGSSSTTERPATTERPSTTERPPTTARPTTTERPATTEADPEPDGDAP